MSRCYVPSWSARARQPGRPTGLSRRPPGRRDDSVVGAASAAGSGAERRLGRPVGPLAPCPDERSERPPKGVGSGLRVRDRPQSGRCLAKTPPEVPCRCWPRARPAYVSGGDLPGGFRGPSRGVSVPVGRGHTAVRLRGAATLRRPRSKNETWIPQPAIPSYPPTTLPAALGSRVAPSTTRSVVASCRPCACAAG